MRFIALIVFLNSLLLAEGVNKKKFGLKLKMCNDILARYGPSETIVSVSWMDSHRNKNSAFGSSITDVRLRPTPNNFVSGSSDDYNIPRHIKMKRFNSNMFDHVNIENISELRLPIAKGNGASLAEFLETPLKYLPGLSQRFKLANNSLMTDVNDEKYMFAAQMQLVPDKTEFVVNVYGYRQLKLHVIIIPHPTKPGEFFSDALVSSGSDDLMLRDWETGTLHAIRVQTEQDAGLRASLDANMALLRDKETRHLANFSFMKSNVIHIQVPLELVPLSCEQDEYVRGRTEIAPGECTKCSNVKCEGKKVRRGECKGEINGYTCVCPPGHFEVSGWGATRCEACFAVTCPPGQHAAKDLCAKVKDDFDKCRCDQPEHYIDAEGSCQPCTNAICPEDKPFRVGECRGRVNGYTCRRRLRPAWKNYGPDGSEGSMLLGSMPTATAAMPTEGSDPFSLFFGGGGGDTMMEMATKAAAGFAGGLRSMRKSMSRSAPLRTSDFLSKVSRGERLKRDPPVPESRRWTYRRDPDPTKRIRVTKLIWWVLPTRVFNEVYSGGAGVRGQALAKRLKRDGDVRAALQDMERQMLFEMEQSQGNKAVPIWDATSNQEKLEL